MVAMGGASFGCKGQGARRTLRLARCDVRRAGFDGSGVDAPLSNTLRLADEPLGRGQSITCFIFT